MSIEIKHILVATDLSEAARATYPHAAALALAFGARVTLLNVDELAGRDHGALETLTGYLDTLRTARNQRIEQAQADLAARGTPAFFEAVPGQARAAIDRYVREHEVDLVVMAQRSRGRLEGVFLGSTVARVLRLSEVPVLVVPADDVPVEAPRYGHLVATSDLGEASRLGLRCAADLAVALGAGLTVVHAVDVPSRSPLLPGDGPPLLTGVQAQQLRDAARERLAEQAREVEGVSVLPTVVVGDDVIMAILDAAAATHASLLVAPAAGKSRLERVFLGSTTERLVRAANLPVLVVPRAYLDRWYGAPTA